MWTVGGLATAFFFVGGWGSNAMSKVTCEERVAQWLHSKPARTPDLLYINSDKRLEDRCETLGFTYVPITGDPYDGNRYPCVKLDASCAIPFVVRVFYHWERGPEIGAAGKWQYLTLFGPVLDLGRDDTVAF